jgi:hypothetical protein
MSKEEPDIFGGKPETKSRQIAICFDTSALPSNISRHSDAKSGADLAAVITLIEGRASGKYQLLSSRLNDRELSETADPSQRAKLKTDYDALGKIERDEQIVGFNTVYDRTGGFVGFPLISDVQDEQTRDELIKMGLSKRDAEHISQALSNDCDYFLTRDEKTIIRPHRDKIEKRFPSLKVRTPLELIAELRSLGLLQ